MVSTGLHRIDDSLRKLRAAQDAKSATAASSGRVVHDARGNAVWNFAVDAGVAALEGTSRLLRKLEVPELALEDTAGAKELRLEESGGGYDPYDRRR